MLFWGAGRRSTARAHASARGSTAPATGEIILSRAYDDAGVGTRAGTPAGHASGVTVTMVVGRRDC